jgi:hypothetical protein
LELPLREFSVAALIAGIIAIEIKELGIHCFGSRLS